MPRVFVFSEDVRQALAEGRKTLHLPPGSRITPAALDLMREYGLEIETSTSESDAAISTPAARAEVFQAPEVTEDDLDTIVKRVMERLQEAHSHGREAAKGEAGDTDGDDVVICRCEEITLAEIKDAIRNGMRTLNGIKRVTRAGMGLCQGQTCERLVTQILSRELGIAAAEVQPTTARAPVRPVRLAVFATG